VQSSRLITWGAIGGLVAGALLTVGYLLALTLAPGSDAANITGTWLTYGGFVALVFFAIGLHEALAAGGSQFEGTGAVLTIIGSVVMTGGAFAAIGSAYGISEEPLYRATELLGLTSTGSVALAVGILLLGLATLRSAALPTAPGALLIAAAAAFVIGGITFLTGNPIEEAFYVGGILLGIGTGWCGADLWRRRADRAASFQ
jgi:hypothetical protein